MDDLKFACPHCQQTITVPASQAGATVECPNANCARQVSVPGAAALPVAAAIPAPPPMPGAGGPPSGAALPPGAAASLPPLAKNGKATASMVLAIIGFVLVCVGSPLAIAAIILGVLALKVPADAYGRKPGRTQAVVGISLGSVALLFALIIGVLAGMLLPVLGKAREKARRVNCAGNLKQVALGLLMYSGDNKGAFPDELSALDKEALLAAGKVYHCPSVDKRSSADGPTLATGDLSTDYDYYGTGLFDDIDDATTTIIAADHAHNHPVRTPWTNVLFVDGHVEGAPAANVQEALALRPHWRLGTDVVKELAAQKAKSGTAPPAGERVPVPLR